MNYKFYLFTFLALLLLSVPPLATAKSTIKGNVDVVPVQLSYLFANIDGVELFYREAGTKTAPVVNRFQATICQL